MNAVLSHELRNPLMPERICQIRACEERALTPVIALTGFGGKSEFDRRASRNFRADPQVDREKTRRALSIRMVAEKGLEPLLSLRKNGFSYHYGFRHQRTAVCGLDYALIRTWSGSGPLPSSLYTFPHIRASLGVAR